MRLGDFGDVTTRSRRNPEGNLGGFAGDRREDATRCGGRGPRRMSALLLVACAVVAVLVARDYRGNAGKVYRGAEVGVVPLRSKTSEEAREVVQRRLARNLRESCPSAFNLEGVWQSPSGPCNASEQGTLAPNRRLIAAELWC